MEEIILKQLAYNYYPKSISPIFQKNEYKNSEEFKNLKKIIDKFKDQSLPKEIEDIREIINQNYFIKLIDKTSFEHLDRCYCFQLVQNKNVIGNLYISMIIPYYIIDLKKTTNDLTKLLCNTIEKK